MELTLNIKFQLSEINNLDNITNKVTYLINRVYLIENVGPVCAKLAGGSSLI